MLSIKYLNHGISFKKGATKEEMDVISKKLLVSKGVDTKKYGGTIKLKEDPLVIQKKMRGEWE